VVPLLKRLNVDSLDALIVTHMHDDHAGGVEHVRRSLAVCRTIATPESVPLARRLMGIDSAVVCGASRGKSFGDSTCRFFVLGPDSGNTGGEENANRRSLILKIQAGDVSMLLMGDAEQEEERVLIARYGEFLRSGVVKVGHHGSRAGTCAEFLDAVDADCALISVGRYNRFGHPSRAVLERLNAAGVEVLRTDESGAIFLTTDGTSVRQFQWR
jgi:competence protein ComEC